ncbi:MAG: hypothetical protein JNL26_17680 [Gemmatimonadetes bacterium]|nr:hypothetical protein [Gemmatimonadota bacterium]
MQLEVMQPLGMATFDLTPCTDPNGMMALQEGTNAPWRLVQKTGGRFVVAASASLVGLMYKSRWFRGTWTSIHYVAASELASIELRQLCEPKPGPGRPPTKSIQFRFPTPQSLHRFVGSAGGYYGLNNLGFDVPVSGQHDLAGFVFTSSVPNPSVGLGDWRSFVRPGIDVSRLSTGDSVTVDPQGPESAALSPAMVDIVGAPRRSVGRAFLAVGTSCFPIFLPFGNRGQLGLSVNTDSLDLDPWRHYGPVPLRGGPTTGASTLLGQDSVWAPPRTQAGLSGVYGIKSVLADAAEVRTLIETRAGAATSWSFQMPSAMPRPTPIVLARAPYLRLRLQFETPPDLNDGVEVSFGWNPQHSGFGDYVSLRASRLFRGGRVVDISTPDFTQLPGWRSDDMPQEGSLPGFNLLEIRGEQRTRASLCSAGRTAASSAIIAL